MMRSFMFVPADDPRKLEKSLTTSADALIFDLEDAVALDKKAEARRCLADFLTQKRHFAKQSIFVRINDLSTGLSLDDLVATMPFRPDGYVLPKSRGGDDIKTLALYLDALEKAYPHGTSTTQIIAVATETASSIFGLDTYKNSSPRLWGMMWGADDLSSDLGASVAQEKGCWTSTFKLVRSMCLLAAADAGVIAIDAVMTDIYNIERLRIDVTDARRDGFMAKAAIHPVQVSVINDAFTPSTDERVWASRVVAAFSSGSGVATLDGYMLDKPHLKLAKRILSRISVVSESEEKHL